MRASSKLIFTKMFWVPVSQLNTTHASNLSNRTPGRQHYVSTKTKSWWLTFLQKKVLINNVESQFFEPNYRKVSKTAFIPQKLKVFRNKKHKIFKLVEIVNLKNKYIEYFP